MISVGAGVVFVSGLVCGVILATISIIAVAIFLGKKK